MLAFFSQWGAWALDASDVMDLVSYAESSQSEWPFVVLYEEQRFRRLSQAFYIGE